MSVVCDVKKNKHERQIKRIKPIRPNILSLRIQSSDLNRRKKKLLLCFLFVYQKRRRFREGKKPKEKGKERKNSGKCGQCQDRRRVFSLVRVAVVGTTWYRHRTYLIFSTFNIY